MDTRRRDGSVPSMTTRVDNANDLGELLTEQTPRANCPPAPDVHLSAEELKGVEHELTEFQELLFNLRDQCVAAGVPLEKL